MSMRRDSEKPLEPSAIEKFLSESEGLLSDPNKLSKRKQSLFDEILPKDFEKQLRNKAAKILIRNKIISIADDITNAQLKLVELGKKFPELKDDPNVGVLAIAITISDRIKNLKDTAKTDISKIVSAVRRVTGDEASKAAVEKGFGKQEAHNFNTTINFRSSELNLIVGNAEEAMKESQEDLKLERKEEKPKIGPTVIESKEPAKTSALKRAAKVGREAPLPTNPGAMLGDPVTALAQLAQKAAAEGKAAMDARKEQAEAKKAKLPPEQTQTAPSLKIGKR